ncbi:MAG TPA: hypothetical protein PLZ05_00855 [Alphaproteobacteria bacterium]|nr:hypothetical protein [Alphaproteobacteria bacterium]
MPKDINPNIILKNTYYVEITKVSNFFESDECVYFPIITINGVLQQIIPEKTVFTAFPNPGASFMLKNFKNMRKILGERLARTIIAYKDKETLEEILMLFPNNLAATVVDDINERLNEASLRDYKNEVDARRILIEKNSPNIR